MSDNLALWDRVEKTDPKHTKPITGKAYSGTSPKPYYLVRKATETFGPCGIGWGFEIVEEKIIDGAVIEPGVHERVHTARVRVWYEWGGKRGVVEHVGQTMFCGKRKNGSPYTDEDAPKKSVTDALVKALSMLGFAGDIFIGLYDDSKYVAGLREEAESERVAPSPRRPVLAEYMIETKEAIDAFRDPDKLREWWAAQTKEMSPDWMPAEKFDELKALAAARLHYLRKGSSPLREKLAESVREARSASDNALMAG